MLYHIHILIQVRQHTNILLKVWWLLIEIVFIHSLVHAPLCRLWCGFSSSFILCVWACESRTKYFTSNAFNFISITNNLVLLALPFRNSQRVARCVSLFYPIKTRSSTRITHTVHGITNRAHIIQQPYNLTYYI